MNVIPTLPTGSNPTVFRPTEEQIQQAATNGLLNLFDQIRAILTQLETTEAAGKRATSTDYDQAAPEDVAADLFYGDLTKEAGDSLPRLGAKADFEHLVDLSRAIFGKAAVREFTRFTFPEHPDEEDADAIRGQAGLAFQIARVFFLSPEGSPAFMLLLAVAVGIVDKYNTPTE